MPGRGLDGGGLARGRTRGGEGIQTLRAKRALTAAGALLLLAAVGASSALQADVLPIPLAVAGAVAVVALAIGLAGRWGPLLQLALTISVVAYAVSLLDRGEVDAGAPFVAAALLAVGELAYTSLEPPARRVWPFSVGMVAAAAGVGRAAARRRGSRRGRGARPRDRRARGRGRARDRRAARATKASRAELRCVERVVHAEVAVETGDLERAARLDGGRGEQEARGGSRASCAPRSGRRAPSSR